MNQQTQEALVLTSIEKNDTRYDIAKQKEIDEWTHFKVYKEVNRNEYPEDEILSCRWVTEEKQSNGGIQYKARLVIRGFEEKNSPQSDSPTASKCVIRLFLAISNIRNFKLKALNVKRAFLQSNQIQRTILVRPPKEFRKSNEIVWKLNKYVYGLNDAARGWFITVRKVLLNLGFESVKLDNSTFVYHAEKIQQGFIVVHVDDFLLGGISNFIQNVVSRLEKEFIIGSYKEDSFTFIGWSINQDPTGITIDQLDYQESLTGVNLSNYRKN